MGMSSCCCDTRGTFHAQMMKRQAAEAACSTLTSLHQCTIAGMAQFSLKILPPFISIPCHICFHLPILLCAKYTVSKKYELRSLITSSGVIFLLRKEGNQTPFYKRTSKCFLLRTEWALFRRSVSFHNNSVRTWTMRELWRNIAVKVKKGDVKGNKLDEAMSSGHIIYKYSSLLPGHGIRYIYYITITLICHV